MSQVILGSILVKSNVDKGSFLTMKETMFKVVKGGVEIMLKA